MENASNGIEAKKLNKFKKADMKVLEFEKQLVRHMTENVRQKLCVKCECGCLDERERERQRESDKDS